MTLYYCTVCALYPCFYNDKISFESMNNETPSKLTSLSSISSDKDLKFTSITNKMNDNNEDELETTSEGLCDFVRELFSLDRQVFNDYQVRVLKKLLLKTSHQQVCFTYLFLFFFFSNI